jgi:hypothetical protein
MRKLINAVLNNFPLVAPAIAILVTAYYVVFAGAELAPTLLQHLLIWCVGAQCIWGATGHLLMPDKVAKGIGWPTGSPFQRELGFVSLGLGIAGLMCGTYTGDFWLAVIIIYSSFLLGAGAGHVYELRKHGNHDTFNAGPIMYTDIVIPLVLIGLYAYVYIR